MEATEEQGKNQETQGLRDTGQEVLPPVGARGRQAGESRGTETLTPRRAVLPQG